MDWFGLDDMIGKFKKATDNVGKSINEAVVNTAEHVLEDVIENTPVNKDPHAVAPGTLHNAWKMRNPRTGLAEVYNDAQAGDGEFYAWDVEYGHRTRAAKKISRKHRKANRKITESGKVLFVPGVFMLRDAMEDRGDIMEKELKKAWDRMFGDW